MHSGKTVFAQLMQFLPLREFRTCVARYDGDYKVQSFSCLDHFLTLAFAQLTYRESLRDIETTLRAVRGKLYHMGFRGVVARNTLAHASEVRDWRIYADFAHHLIATARTLYADDDLGVELTNTIYALDATTIDLCLSLFPWATFRRQKGAIKLHTLLDLRGNIPTVLYISPAAIGETRMLDIVAPEAGAIYVLDRGYLDFSRFYSYAQAGAFFVTRAKRRIRYARVRSHPLPPDDAASVGLTSDQTIRLTGPLVQFDYPAPLRRVRLFDADESRELTFFTNHFAIPAATVAALYKLRWQVELFFKWIKQHLRIKAFYGTSQNAVKTQVWIAISVYVLIAIIRRRLGVTMPLSTILQVFSLTLFEKTQLPQLLTDFNTELLESPYGKQLSLFEL